MFINVAEELKKARSEKYALGAFNTANLEVTKAICAAAKNTDSAVIIQVTPSAIEYAGLMQIFDIVKNEIEESGIKAAIHLDHGKDFEVVREAIDAGFRSVMIDGSKLPFAENVALTKKVVEYAHPKNVAVEGEIGVIATPEGGNASEGDATLSTPEQTGEFVRLTGVDSIAISIGNEHGAPEGEKIDLNLLKKISDLVSIPLVMHGTSGLTDDDVRAAVKLGVTKVNVDTNIRRAFIDGISDFDPEIRDYREILKVCMENVEEVVEERIRLLSSKA
jgi:fructose-bisphosphate aldolase class II